MDESTYLYEEELVDELLLEEDQKQLKHLHHLEDLMITNGSEGFDKIAQTVLKTHDHLQGKKNPGFSIQTKFDGSPSVLWGHDPKSKKFFVGTKSYFNKTPKVNYTDKDVDLNHGNSKTLSDKMKFLLKHLKKVTPKEGVFQGDLMYTGHDISQSNSNISFTPNTLTYNIDKNSHEGQKILKSKIGIAPHTHYEQDEKGNLRAVYDINMNEFKPDDSIHFLPTKLRGPFKYQSHEISAVNKHMSEAIKDKTSLDRTGAFEAIKPHQKTLLAYINHTVKQRTSPNVQGYISFLYNQLSKRSSNPKDSTKNQLNTEAKNILDNKASFEKLFKIHKNVQEAKNTLINVLSKNSPYNETILGNKSKPEGFVVSVDGSPIKLVDRQHFSAANFDWNEKVNPTDNPTVLSFGRFNPPTKGHEKIINKGTDIARRIGAKHKTIATPTQDKKNNPLTPQQKVQWLKTMFPGQDIAIAGKGQHTIIAQLQHLHNSGVRDVTMVVGDDRVKEFSNVLAKYNGDGFGKLFNFRRARVVSGGARDPDSTDSSEAISATKMRQAAKKGDFESFKGGLSKKLHNKAGEIFHSVRAGMSGVSINQSTPGHSLATYAKRTDKTGEDARKEIQRRRRNGTWKGE